MEIDMKNQTANQYDSEAQIARQNEIRAGIRDLLMPIQRALESIRFLCNRLPKSFVQLLLSPEQSSLVHAIFSLAPFPFITVQVRQTLADIVNMGIDRCGWPLFVAVYVVARFGTENRCPTWRSGRVRRCCLCTAWCRGLWSRLPSPANGEMCCS